MIRLSGLLMLVCGWLHTGIARAQVSQEQLLQKLASVADSSQGRLKYPEQVKQFYSLHQYKTAWIDNPALSDRLLEYITGASWLGLKSEDYQRKLLLETDDSLAVDIEFTDVAIHFFSDVAYGSQPPAIGYNGLKYYPGCFSIPALLSQAIASGSFGFLLYQVELQSPEYVAVKSSLASYLQWAADSLERKKTSKADLLAAKKRVEGLGRTLNTLRWLRCAREQNPNIIVVNIPSASLLVYSRDGVAMESKVIVGKRTNRTPTLCSRITEVILYPYWSVPKNIAVRELLPLIKKDIGYLDANNFQVINTEGRVIHPSAIDWKLLSAANFPYTLRQSTGCDNSLGLVKLNFYSPYVVYLHDTPWKSLFLSAKRFYSHGCMRVEKAMELARLVMKDNTAVIDTLTEKGCLYNQRPITLPASEKMPVFVLYNTAWVDSAATVRFYEDIYNKFPKAGKL